MKEPPPPLLQLSELQGLSPFVHEAMATRFTLYLAPPPTGSLRAIAEEAFRLLDQVEDRLSFYREGSDVTRINRARSGETVRLHDTTHRCLLTALEIALVSEGAFDPFAGAASLAAKAQPVPAHLADLAAPAPGENLPVLALAPDQPLVTKLEGRRWLDLGAVGKGAALDALAELLQEWEVPAAVLVGGGSSVLVYGCPVGSETPDWTVRLPQAGDAPVTLRAPFALGASGEGFQPGHLIARPGLRPRPQAVVVAPSAALADALSTAAVLLPQANLQVLAADAAAEGIAVLATVRSLDEEPVCTGAFAVVRPALPTVAATLVIPCWCESARLPAFLPALAAALERAALPVEIVVVDDGSPGDEPTATAAVVDAVRVNHPLVRPLLRAEHRGKGGAVYWGWKHGTPGARWLALVDADGAVPPDEVVRGLRLALAAPAADHLIAASRYHRDRSRRVRRGPVRQRTGGWFARWAQRQLGLGADDSQCGFKLVPAAWWRNRNGWNELGYAFDLELLIAARDDALPVHNLAIAWQEVGGSNVTWRDGWRLVETVRRLKSRPPA